MHCTNFKEKIITVIKNNMIALPQKPSFFNPLSHSLSRPLATMERGHSSLKLLIGALLLSAVFAEVTDKDVVKARVEVRLRMDL